MDGIADTGRSESEVKVGKDEAEASCRITRRPAFGAALAQLALRAKLAQSRRLSNRILDGFVW